MLSWLRRYIMTEIKMINNFVDKMSYDIDNLPVSEFIAYAKKYNIFKTSHSKFYDFICDKIKARLDREGLDYEIVRPE